MKKEIDTLIFSGGGIKALAYIGVLKKIEQLILSKSDDPDNNVPIFDIKHICGISAGAIFALLYILGYTSEEIGNEAINKKFHRLRSIKFSNIVSDFGIDSGNNILLWIESLILNKGYNKDITLEELYTYRKIRFDIIATNLNKYQYTIFNYLNTPHVKVTDAIRMSISIPFIFTVVKFNSENCKVGEGHVHVDGGLIESYPLHLFKDNLEKVIGMKLMSGKGNNYENTENIDTIENYTYHVLNCFVAQRDRRIVNIDMYKKHTIYIDIKNLTSSINFGLSTINKKKLIDIGYEAATKYFENN